MPRVTCGKCSRELEYSGASRPMFCAFCGQSLGDPSGGGTTEGWSGAGRPADRTVDFVPKARPRGRDDFPERVKDFRLIRQLGRGGMGTVFEAEDGRNGRKVALKIIAPGYVDSSGAVDRFRREGRLASTLAHPRCVFVLEADEDEDGRPFIAMELMTGDTLQDLVEKGGPLAIGDAVGKILDVTEGLAEAHRLGLIHRDVKPSNCFLDVDGRVKVGDFGLSKSQVGSASLTRTGAFLGTPLYASPEQIKVEPLDARTDVYSTAATLFFLLTGRAPFDRGDASATMARIVTDPAPSARQRRPEVPLGLDRAIRKGLERDVDRRFRDLDEFRAALQPFQPGVVPPARFALRVGAYLFDALLVLLVLVVVDVFEDNSLARIALNFLAMFAYFSIGDGVWGGTLGKRLLRLAVADAEGRDRPGLGRAALRSLVFLALADIPLDVLVTLDDPWERWPLAFGIGGTMALAGGLLALASPMKAANDYRGLHELASGTRVVWRPRGGRRRSGASRRPIGRDRGSVTRPVGVMQVVGPYKVRGAVRWEADRRVVSGEDSSLGREAWIVIRPKGSPAPGPARREVSRSTRPRWLAGGEQQEGRWDAYVAPAGCPIADLAGADGLSWHDARPILEDLADELAAACAEGSLPPGLTVDQVWVQPDGRAILVDPLAHSDPSPNSAGPPAEARALSLIRRVAAIALEGGRRRADVEPDAIRSPVPLHACRLVRRLLPGPDAYPTVEALRADLAETRHHSTEVTRGQRALSVVIFASFVAFGLGTMFAVVYALLHGYLDEMLTERSADVGVPMNVVRVRFGSFAALAFPALWIGWDFLTRGGFALKLSGLGLVRWDGRPASRWRCAWRSALVWLPVAMLLVASLLVRSRIANPAWPSWTVFGLAVALLPAYILSALVSPDCGPHDRLSGLRVVPR